MRLFALILLACLIVGSLETPLLNKNESKKDNSSSSEEEINENSNENVWNYDELGADIWTHLHGDMFKNCGKSHQSPINISNEFIKCDPEIRPVKFQNYLQKVNFTFQHTGSTIRGTPDKNTNLEISEGILPSDLSPFKLQQLHFHWGNNEEGSEHLINGKQFPLEMHLVHASTRNPKRLAVVAVLFEISEESNKNLDDIIYTVYDFASIEIDHFDRLIDNKQKNNLTFSFNMGLILPNKNKFFFYEGSLTVPPCLEKVLWCVFTDKVPISRLQLKAFHKNNLKHNFRKPQPLNDRYVYTNECKPRETI